MTGAWDRDLAIDLDAIRGWGATAVVTLLEPHEMKLLKVERLGEEVLSRHMEWFHLPIVDVSIPDARFEKEWRSAGERLRSLLRSGRDVLVHCRGGLGRAGTIGARLLVELGMDATTAIARVRGARAGAIQTRDQEKFVLGVGALRGDGKERPMDWFEQLTGFREKGYEDTRAKLEVEGRRLRSKVNGKSYGVGELELVSLQALRARVKSAGGPSGRIKVGIVTGDVRRMHQAPEYAGALFQVASQFNLLEMVSSSVTPEDGVTRYVYDRTQGPACAIAAGAATIYRNYFGGGYGQTRERQFDGLADLGETLARAMNRPVRELWNMQNGYALCSQEGLTAIAAHLQAQGPAELDELRTKLRVGIHRDVEVTDATGDLRPLVSQAFCSALPVSSATVPRRHWQAFASLVLEAAYEATMWAGVLNAQRGASKVVLLTQVGGGAFGNDEKWISAATSRALELVWDYDLDVKLVSYGAPSPAILELAKRFT
jgi:protein-tyrosine phosphatase